MQTRSVLSNVTVDLAMNWQKTNSLVSTLTSALIHLAVMIVLTLLAGNKTNHAKTFESLIVDLSLFDFHFPFSFNCSCPEGMQLNSDSLTCGDIDECEIHSPCSHICENVEKRFRFAYFRSKKSDLISINPSLT